MTVSIRFETREVEDRVGTNATGVYSTLPKDMAFVKQIGSQDEIVVYVDEWFESLRWRARALQDPSILDALGVYEMQYKAWKAGNEIPVNGTSVRTCQIYSTQEVERLLAAGLRTLEDIIDCPSDPWKRIQVQRGLVVSKAQEFLRRANNSEAEITDLKAKVAALEEALESRAPVPRRGRPPNVSAHDNK